MRLALALIALTTIPASAQETVPLLPDLSKTPGPASPVLDRDKLCNSAFTTKPYRKASKPDRKCVMARYGKPAYAFTYDHLVPLELGGADSCDNLWPQPRAEAKRKDQLEGALRSHVCVCHDITLSAAQELIRSNWLAGYARFVTPKGSPMCPAHGAPNS